MVKKSPLDVKNWIESSWNHQGMYPQIPCFISWYFMDLWIHSMMISFHKFHKFHISFYSFYSCWYGSGTAIESESSESPGFGCFTSGAIHIYHVAGWKIHHWVGWFFPANWRTEPPWLVWGFSSHLWNTQRVTQISQIVGYIAYISQYIPMISWINPHLLHIIPMKNSRKNACYIHPTVWNRILPDLSHHHSCWFLIPIPSNPIFY